MRVPVRLATPLSVAAVLAMACGNDLPAPPAHGTGDAGDGGGDDDGGGGDDGDGGDDGGGDDDGGGAPKPDVPPPGPPGGDECEGLGCLPCGNDRGCAPEGQPYIGDTCCTEGDALMHLGWGGGAEVVDLETDGTYVVTCGGFGAVFDDITDPMSANSIGSAASRCQNAAFGAVLDDGRRVVYLAHHGDTWVAMPFLGTYTLAADGSTVTEDVIDDDPAILFEGLAWRDDVLYAATHAGGLRVYETDASGVPTFVTTVDGFENAVQPAIGDSVLYVADGAGGVKVLSLADPLAPAHVTNLDLLGLSKDVRVEGDRLYVALGGDGADVYDVAVPDDPMLVGHIDGMGSVQSVAADGEIVALASWSHVGLYDRETLQLLATERVLHSPSFEQDLAVEVRDGIVYVGEWEGLHVLMHRPGRVAPDIWIEDELLAFPGEVATSRTVVVRNRGYLDLDVWGFDTGLQPQFSVDEDFLRVEPGKSRAFEVSYVPPPPEFGDETLFLDTNDPDKGQSPLKVPLVARAGARLDVGDPIGDEFGFLDPTGVGEVANLEGHVVVLAYFALF